MSQLKIVARPRPEQTLLIVEIDEVTVVARSGTERFVLKETQDGAAELIHHGDGVHETIARGTRTQMETALGSVATGFAAPRTDDRFGQGAFWTIGAAMLFGLVLGCLYGTISGTVAPSSPSGAALPRPLLEPPPAAPQKSERICPPAASIIPSD